MRDSLRQYFVQTVCLTAALGLTATATAAPADAKRNALVLDDSSQWRFLGGAFRVDAEGSFQHPEKRNLHARAIYMKKAFSDVTVEFDYKAGYLEGGTGTAGLILRAPNGGCGYMVQFSWNGQTMRAKNFWAGLAELSGDGYLRHLKFDLVDGVPPETDRWYSVKVVAWGRAFASGLTVLKRSIVLTTNIHQDSSAWQALASSGLETFVTAAPRQPFQHGMARQTFAIWPPFCRCQAIPLIRAAWRPTAISSLRPVKSCYDPLTRREHGPRSNCPPI